MDTDSTSFSSNQFSDLYPPKMEHHYWVKGRNLILEKEIAEILNGESSGKNEANAVLDIGCGPGIVINHLREAGFNAWGVELGHPEIRLPCKEWIFTGRSVRDLDAELRNSIRVATFLDVLEHLREPEMLLKETLEYLPNLKFIIITVPARQELWCNFDEYNGHFRRYTRTVMTALLNLVGLRPKKLEYFFHALYIPAFFLRLLNLPRRTKHPSPSHLWIHALLAKAFVLERKLIPTSWRGSSLLAVVPTASPRL
jgi:2-polyprenyl-3-methyl-5-hydroxy-6-metoxy-1,4-benzoquinol methylase